MIQLTEAEMAIFYFWRDYIRSHSNRSVRSSLLFYLMVEEVIAYYHQLPDDKRPPRPSEYALMDIGATSGALSKWRAKWHKIWLSMK